MTATEWFMKAQIEQLETENKSLKEMNSKLWEMNGKLGVWVDKLEKENKNLKDDLLHYIQREEEYREKIQTLELWLDNKEKLNEEYRKQIDKYKLDLWECECSFWFEADEVWFRKREYKRLKQWIKEHCKWYWNLFPEDEMKRQRKKAEKKRKKYKNMETDTLQELKEIWELEDDELIYEEWLYD